MSVTPETFQQSMAPYVAVAAVRFESYSVTAVCSEALSAKVVQAGGGEGEGGGGLGEGGGGDGDGGGGNGEGGGGDGEGGGGLGDGGGGLGGGKGEGGGKKRATLVPSPPPVKPPTQTGSVTRRSVPPVAAFW